MNATEIRIRDRAEAVGVQMFIEAGPQTFEATIATGEGLLNGIILQLVQRVGVERAYQIIQAKADGLDRIILDAVPPCRPNACRQV